MLIGTFSGFDVYAETYVVNHAFGRPDGIVDIFGFRGVVVPEGMPQKDPSAIPFANQEHEGYREKTQANAVALDVGQAIALRLAGSH